MLLVEAKSVGAKNMQHRAVPSAMANTDVKVPMLQKEIVDPTAAISEEGMNSGATANWLDISEWCTYHVAQRVIDFLQTISPSFTLVESLLDAVVVLGLEHHKTCVGASEVNQEPKSHSFSTVPL